MKKISLLVLAVLISATLFGCASKDGKDVPSNKLYLIADGSQRIVKYDTTKALIQADLENIKIKKGSVKLNVYPGKRPAEGQDGAEAAFTATFDITNEKDFALLTNGYDIIQHAASVKILNALLETGKFYYAKATLSYTTGSSSTVETYTIYSNDTVYTPLTIEEMVEITEGREK